MRAKKKTVTIVDIARHVGVSASTVSRALTGNIPVAPETQAAIWEAIEYLGYRPNQNARGLVNGNSMVVGVLTQDIASAFFGAILAGIERELDGSAYTSMIIPGSWHVDKEIRALDILLGRQVDGLIVLSGDIADDQLIELSHELPLIVVGRTVPGLEQDCLQVDNFQGAYSATRHLVELGHRRIVHVAGPVNQHDAARRRDGYCQALVDSGLKVDKNLIVDADFGEQSGLMAVETLMTRGTLFSAVFASNDQIADGVLLGLYRHGLRVPRDVSVIGFDDQPGSAYTIPPLTTVRQPTWNMGVGAARGMLSLLQQREVNLPTIVPELVIRESTTRVGTG